MVPTPALVHLEPRRHGSQVARFGNPGEPLSGPGLRVTYYNGHRGPMPNSPGGGPAFPVFGHALTMANGVQLAQVLMLFQGLGMDSEKNTSL